MNLSQELGRFVSRLAILLPADFEAPLGRLDPAPPDLAPASAPPRLPVCRYWDQAVAGTAGPMAPLLAALDRLAPALRWVQNPNYVARPPSAGFLDGYGYAVLVGPGGLAESDRLAVGLLMLGPGIHYPRHSHPAVEVYVVLAGEGEWQKGEAPWQRRPPGAVIRHDSLVPHATRALEEPLLAAYVWRGDLATHARIIAKPADSGL
jgi:quercetin dioxygenase-like cupin family protein